MPKTTIAQLEAALIDSTRNVLELAEAVRLLNERLNHASEAFKAQRTEIKALRDELAALRESQHAERPVTRVQTPGKVNPWFVALKQLREERGLAPEAWVDRAEVLARMEHNAAQH